MRPGHDYFIVFAPLIFLFLTWRTGKGLLSGRLRGARMKPLFGGRYRHLMQSRVWMILFFATLFWAAGWIVWFLVT